MAELEGESDPEKDKELEELTQLIEGTVMRLMEHVDSVQIFVTRHKPAGKDTATQHYSWGDGNFYTRYGHIKSWIIKQDAIIRSEVLND